MPSDPLIRIDNDESETPPPRAGTQPWHVLIVDDDEQVHLATRLALKDLEYKGRPIALASCYSAWEAFEHMAARPDIACVLLDVVMEDEQAGLDLVHRIRNDLKNQQMRIILRTGQPGYAPELQVIRQYDINDYKAKTELTVTRLASSIITALRSYEQIVALERHRQGLEKVINASANLFSERNVDEFSAGVLIQLAAQLGVEPEGILCAQGAAEGPVIVAAAGRYAHALRKSLKDFEDPAIVAALLEAFARGTGFSTDTGDIIYLQSGSARPAAIYTATPLPVDERQRELLRLFTMNVALGFETATLFGHLRDLAFVDQMTGLSSRAGFIDMVSKLPDTRGLAVYALDIDQFDLLNAQIGFEAGDLLLRLVSQRLREGFSDALCVLRSSGDRFAIALRQLEPDGVHERLAALFAQPFRVAGRLITLSITGGYAVCKEMDGPLGDGVGSTGEVLLQNAFQALKEAKMTARGTLLRHDPAVEARARAGVRRVAEVRDAIRHDQFILHYQPLVDLETGAPVRAEALLRWQSPDYGLLAPNHFLAAAENSGLIVPLGLQVLEKAIRQRQAWRKDGLEVPVAINVSAVQLQQPDFLETLDAVLANQGADATGLEIEITETMFAGDEDHTVRMVQGLRQRGFDVALDDFGTGYSSLSYLSRLPVTAIKVDRRFVAALGEDPKAALLVRTIAQVAEVVGAVTVAEGVEEEAQATALRGMGIDIGQGFLFSRPLTPHSLSQWWRIQGAPTALHRPPPPAQ